MSRKSKPVTMQARRARTGYLFILPFIIGLILFMLKPLVQSLTMSFNSVKLIPGQGFSQSWVGIDNYRTAFLVNPNFNQYLTNEISRMGINTIATLVLSFVIAVILNQDFQGRTLARAIFFLPVILSSGILPGIEKQNEFYDMMAGVAASVGESAGVNISASLQELLSQSEQSYRASSVIDRTTHVNTLVQLLALLKNDNENLYKVTIHVTLYNRKKEKKKDLKKRVLRVLSEQGFELSDNFCNQSRAMISMNPSVVDNMVEFQRAIHSNSVAAVFPFVLSTMMEKGGVTIGESKGFPVIVDFFARNQERVNSNMVIMGKSGSGKSYSTKTLLTHLATENCKIFILDPENEYDIISENLGGKLIDTAKTLLHLFGDRALP